MNDLDRISILFNEYRMFYKCSSGLDSAKNFIKARMELQESVIFKAELENKIVGFAQLYPLFSSVRMKKLWLLNDLYINEDCRNKGIGKALIEKCKDLVIKTDACALCLETTKDNLAGNSLYTNTGFVKNTTSNFYEWTNLE